MTALTRMRCAGLNAQGYGGYNAHPGSTPYVVVVPFKEAIFAPPTCSVHERPYLTDGGYDLAQLARRFMESGEITDECEVYYGIEQASGCPPHGWYGSASDTFDGRCPYWRLAAWIVRRHEYGVSR